MVTMITGEVSGSCYHYLRRLMAGGRDDGRGGGGAPASIRHPLGWVNRGEFTPKPYNWMRVVTIVT